MTRTEYIELYKRLGIDTANLEAQTDDEFEIRQLHYSGEEMSAPRSRKPWRPIASRW